MFDLMGKGDLYFRANSSLFPALLTLAAECGWEPAGAIARELRDTPDGLSIEFEEPLRRCDYGSNDFQWVEDTDAAAMAAALRWALDNPCDPRVSSWVSFDDYPRLLGMLITQRVSAGRVLLTFIERDGKLIEWVVTLEKANQLMKEEDERRMSGGIPASIVEEFVAFSSAGGFSIE